MTAVNVKGGYRYLPVSDGGIMTPDIIRYWLFHDDNEGGPRMHVLKWHQGILDKDPARMGWALLR